MSWREIPIKEYLELYCASYTITQVKDAELNGLRAMEVHLSEPGQPDLKHQINGRFQVKCFIGEHNPDEPDWDRLVEEAEYREDR